MIDALDSDRAVTEIDSDEFGFQSIAESLAPRITDACRGDGLVIGLEGSWGSGKSSLMNLIHLEIESLSVENVHSVVIAPWLDGDSSSLVMSMLGQIAKVLDDKSETSDADVFKEKTKELGRMVADYGERTARWATPMAKLAGHVFPGAGLVANITESTAGVLENFKGESQTVSELKMSISQQLKQLNQGFVVFLDDLDRLEPEQAVEVIRLVRSVADFPKVVYLMCYDREVLANGLKVGLNVTDGDLFLQKIVQLTFKIPLLEPFELQQQLFKTAQLIYKSVNSKSPDELLLNDLRWNIDFAGQGLSTPREVKLTLNAIRFSYPAIATDVYFPDLCWLHLIKVTNQSLYRWLEEYLSVRSTISTGYGNAHKEYRAELGERLYKLLPSDSHTSPDSINTVRRFIPGIIRKEKPEDRVFAPTYQHDEQKAVSKKRIGSSVHFRFYFALTGPTKIMSDKEFEHVIHLAEKDPTGLHKCLDNFARTLDAHQFDRLLFRLDNYSDSITPIDTLESLVRGIASVMDVLIGNQKKTKISETTLNEKIDLFLYSCLKKIGENDNSRKVKLGLWMVNDLEHLGWLVGEFMRGLLFFHGRIGDEQVSKHERIFSEEELDQLIVVICKRLESEEVKNKIPSLPNMSNYLYGWKHLVYDDSGVTAWVEGFCVADDNFLQFLNSLRHQMMSDKMYYPLAKKSISTFLDFTKTKARLEEIKLGNKSDEAADLLNAIAIAER